MTEVSETYFAEVAPFTGEPGNGQGGGNLIPLPQAPMIQAKTQYMTAVQVQKPRDLDKVVAAVKREAALAGEAFYWAWPVKDKRTGKKKMLDGPSIGLAMCVAREWTNVAIPVDYSETATHDIFNAHFVDLEKGFTVSRIWKQSKKANKDLDSYGDRAVNMTFQAAQSRAIRNAVLAGVPKWLVDQAKEIAKDSVLKGITPEKIAAAKEIIITTLKGFGVDEAQIVAVAGVPMAQWAPQDIVMLKGMITQIRDGNSAVEELFPSIEEPDKKPAKTTKKAAPGAQPPAQDGAAGGTGAQSPLKAITPETLARIQKVIKEKDIDPAMICQDAEVSTLEELTEEAAVAIAVFYEKTYP